MTDRARCEALRFEDGVFEGMHRGFGLIHRRRLSLDEDGLRGVDELDRPARARVWFRFGSGLRWRAGSDGRAIELEGRRVQMRLESPGGGIRMEQARIAPGYGIAEPAPAASVELSGSRLEWSLRRLER
ncbi:MAG: heparinase II/III family protein [Planctomycetota bacterium]